MSEQLLLGEDLPPNRRKLVPADVDDQAGSSALPDQDDGPEVLEELERFDAEAGEAIRRGERRGPQVQWAQDADQPDYAHTLASNANGVVPPKRFTLTASVLELLIGANHFEPEGHGDEIVFALRGGKLEGGDSFEDVDAVAIIDTRPDHATFCCTIGTLNRRTGKLRAFAGSTVPNKNYMLNYYRMRNGIQPYRDISCNILPTGCYIFRVGSHGGGRIRPALRMTDPDRLTEDGVCTVLRTSNDLTYKHDDFWDPAKPYDNIHCAYFDDKFSSAGCQTIKGQNGKGPWGRFQAFLSCPKDTRFDYVLLTGREAAIAAQIIAMERANDAGLVRACLERLRVGSEGEAVTRLQKKLGFNGTAYFGPSTKKRLTEQQREKGVASDGVYAPELDAAFGWDVFEAPYSSTAVPSQPSTSTGRLDPSTLHFLAPDGDHQLSEDRRHLVIPGEGSWQITDSGSIAFTPAEGFVGQTSPVRYAICDALGAVITRAVRVEVKPTPPQLKADKVQTNEGEPVQIDVLANDVGVDGKLQPSSLIFVDPPPSAVLSSDGRKMDVPGEGQWRIDKQSGMVTFSPALGVRDRRITAHYQVADDRGATATAEIVVIITRPNDAPLAATTSAGQVVTIDVLGNDQRPDDTVAPQTYIDVDKPPLAGTDGGEAAVVRVTADQVRRFAPRAKQHVIDSIAESADQVLSSYDINVNARRLCHFMAQVGHECGGFTIMRESLNYTTAKRLTEVWPSRFPTLASAQPYVRNEPGLAEKVYGGRLGNTQPGDGYRYRGRGFIQLTGRVNYRQIGEILDLPLEAEPERAAEPREALLIACEVWKEKQLVGERSLNTLADEGKVEAITYRINGGYTNLKGRREELERAQEIWGGSEPTGEAQSAILDRGDRSEAIKDLQQALQRKGYYSERVDGHFGYSTYKALRRCSQALGLGEQGFADERLLRALRDAPPRRRSGGTVTTDSAIESDDSFVDEEPVRNGTSLGEDDDAVS